MNSEKAGKEKRSKRYQILLLTNRDSDNVGDQIIEICDIALIKTVMENLNIPQEDYRIINRAASVVSKKYVRTKDPALLATLHRLAQKVDLIIFGGAPLFNYKYQIFYERTAVTLEVAESYGTPVIFSAIGIEAYDEHDPKCQRLKAALNLDCVRQITTRDGIEELRKYKENSRMIIDRVSDPAVFSSQVFQEYTVSSPKKDKKKVGIFVFRANGFVDNNINVTKDDAAKLWLDIIHELERRGYEYTLLTSGNFGDEAFLDYLIRQYGVKEAKCVFNMNSPEKLMRKLSHFQAVISCRLHPSIISYSLGVPSVGLVWNPKISYFYECIGYPERKIEMEGIHASMVVDRVEQAMEQGVEKQEDYLQSVYQYLFQGIQNALSLETENAKPYDYETLAQRIPGYPGTTPEELEDKIKRKFRRAYSALNDSYDRGNVVVEKAKSGWRSWFR